MRLQSPAAAPSHSQTRGALPTRLWGCHPSPPGHPWVISWRSGAQHRTSSILLCLPGKRRSGRHRDAAPGPPPHGCSPQCGAEPQPWGGGGVPWGQPGPATPIPGAGVALRPPAAVVPGTSDRFYGFSRETAGREAERKQRPPPRPSLEPLRPPHPAPGGPLRPPRGSVGQWGLAVPWGRGGWRGTCAEGPPCGDAGGPVPSGNPLAEVLGVGCVPRDPPSVWIVGGCPEDALCGDARGFSALRTPPVWLLEDRYLKAPYVGMLEGGAYAPRDPKWGCWSGKCPKRPPP